MLLAVPLVPADAAPVLGGYAISYAQAEGASPLAASRMTTFATSGSLAIAAASQGPGTATNAASQSGAWLDRIAITSAASRGIVVGSALSVFAINQTVTGAAGTTAHVSYTFGIDGSFAPGAASHYPPPAFAPPQNLTFYLLAYPGRATSMTVATDGG